MFDWSEEKNNLIVWHYIYRPPKALFGNEMRDIQQFFPYNFSPVQFNVRHAGEPILMALDINSDLDFGLPARDKKATAVIVLCLSVCICLLGGYQFRFCCEHDHFKNSAERVFERDMKKYSKRMGKYRDHASDGSDEKPVHDVRAAPAAGEFHGFGEEAS